MNTDIQITEA